MHAFACALKSPPHPSPYNFRLFIIIRKWKISTLNLIALWLTRFFVESCFHKLLQRFSLNKYKLLSPNVQIQISFVSFFYYGVFFVIWTLFDEGKECFGKLKYLNIPGSFRFSFFWNIWLINLIPFAGWKWENEVAWKMLDKIKIAEQIVRACCSGKKSTLAFI